MITIKALRNFSAGGTNFSAGKVVDFEDNALAKKWQKQGFVEIITPQKPPKKTKRSTGPTEDK